ncbi:MAG: TIGR01777 family oxidoreductase [Solirubrobacterales bacterium]
MRILISGATGLIGSRLADTLRSRGDEVHGLSRDTERARETDPDITWHEWDPKESAPVEAFEGTDAVVHLAGEPIAQRWNDETKRRLRESRIESTATIVEAIRQASDRPAVLVSASAVGYYGPRGDERVDESADAGTDFLAELCRDWEAEARQASDLGVRVVTPRTGVVLSPEGGALEKMLPPFKAGVGGPVAGGDQYMPWIHLDDEVGMLVWAIDSDISGPVNFSAPEPVTNKQFSKALGRALNRPAVLPVPGLAIKALYGDMAVIVNKGQRAVPAKALDNGYEHRFTDLDAALEDAVG